MTENHQQENRTNTWADYAAQQTGNTQAPAPSRSGRRRIIIGAAALLAVGGVAGGTALANASSTVPHSAVAGYQAGPAVDPSETAAAPSTASDDTGTGTSDAGTTPAPPDSDSSTPAPPQHEPHLDGTVTGTADGAITIKDHEGFTRVINVSDSTKYTDDLTATPAGGTEIHAVGTVNADGISLDATEVGARPTPPAGGPGADGEGPGGKGPGGKGPGADAPKPPADGEAPAAPSDAPQPPTDGPAAPSTGSSAPTTTG